MEDGRDTGLEQALRLVAAMEGEDTETRISLWRAAIRYRNRDRDEQPGGWELSRVLSV